MGEVMIVGVVGLLMAALSVAADARFHHCDHLPMQWSFSGAVTWTAPRTLALGFTPVLAVCVLVPILATTPRAGQEDLQRPLLAIVGVAFLAAHVLHL